MSDSVKMPNDYGMIIREQRPMSVTCGHCKHAGMINVARPGMLLVCPKCKGQTTIVQRGYELVCVKLDGSA